jgi:ABC-2 type transport system permease protein
VEVAMKLILIHAKWMFLELFRQPAYLVSTIAFPSIFYLIFAVPESNDVASANFLIASFSGFTVFNMIFLQFDISLTQERTKS